MVFQVQCKLAEQIGRTTHCQFSWSAKDAVLYAVGIGITDDPLDERALRYVRHPPELVFPTFAAALARNVAPTMADLGGNYDKTVLFAQHLAIERPLPPAGAAIAESTVIGVEDRGPARGAILSLQTRLLNGDGSFLARILTLLLARGDGGGGSGGATMPTMSLVPERRADSSIVMSTRPDQAIIYALSGDNNPLHICPAEARKRGFDRPILHGLCTYAIAARAVASCIDLPDADALRSLEARFTAPVFSGETLRFDMWKLDDSVAFEGFSLDRGLRVLANGNARF